MGLRFGIIGGGMIARFHAKAIHAMEGGQLHSVYGVSQEQADTLAKEVALPGQTVLATDDLKKMLADPELDIVTIATPSGAHLSSTMAALRAGKHVICEKPLEVTVDRIDQMVKQAQLSGVTLAAVLNRRFQPALGAMKQAMDLGRFGRLSLCNANIQWYRPQAYYDQAEWRGTWALDGGGALMNQSIHTIDQLIYLTETVTGPVETVSATTSCVAHERIEVEDTAVATLSFESGAKGIIQGSTACFSKQGIPAEVFIGGDQGTAAMTDEAIRHWDFAEDHAMDADVANLMAGAQKQALGANDPSAIHADGHRKNFEEVVQSIEQGRPCAVSAQEARKAVALINAIYQSAKEGGEPVAVDQG